MLELFITWAAGAAVYVVPASQLMAPAKFIRDHALTIWFSVPSTACIMERMKMLKPGAFPIFAVLNLRRGGACQLLSAQAWQIAAPNSVVENFYGPTEANRRLHRAAPGRTSQCHYKPRNTGHRQAVPGIRAGIVDAKLKFLPQGKEGELVVSGRQVARGYFQDPELTAARFPTLDGTTMVSHWGFGLRRMPPGPFTTWVESTTRSRYLATGSNLRKSRPICAKLWEQTWWRRWLGRSLIVRATGIVAFHCTPGVTRDQIRDGMKKRVPDYMVPQRVHKLDALPLGSSGKIDRQALIRMLDEQSGLVRCGGLLLEKCR